MLTCQLNVNVMENVKFTWVLGGGVLKVHMQFSRHYNEITLPHLFELLLSQCIKFDWDMLQ